MRNKLVSFLLSVILTFGVIPVGVVAADNGMAMASVTTYTDLSDSDFEHAIINMLRFRLLS